MAFVWCRTVAGYFRGAVTVVRAVVALALVAVLLQVPSTASAQTNSPPAFSLSTTTRVWHENTVSGNVGAAVSASDADGDTLTYSVAQATLGGADDLTAFNEDFVLDTATGQVSVKANGSIDFEDRASYIVDIGVTDSKDSVGAPDSTIDDTVTLTIQIIDVEEFGAVTVSGTARVGETLTADVTDPDGGVTGVGWVWSRAATVSGTFSAISGATASSYTLTSNDENMWVRATATYTDRRGSGKTANATTGSIAANSPAAFADASVSRTVDENTVSGNVGSAVSASDADGDTLTYSVAQATLGGADDLTAFNADFVLDTATGQVSVKAGASIDFEDRASYIVDIGVTDSKDSVGAPDSTIDDTVTLTIQIIDVEEFGAVTVSGTARVGETLTADVTDPDGDVTGVTWVWSRAATASGTFSAISGATASSYTLTSNDENMWVRATATYTDRRGSAKTANATTGPIAANSPAAFADASVSRTVAETTVSGNVGSAVSASDADGDTLTYSVAQATSGGADDLTAFNEDFVLDTATGQISVKAGASIDFEDRASYIVVIEVTDSIDSSTTIDDTVTLTINVSDVEEPGAVTVSGTARVGETLTANVTDPDGVVTGVTWVWSRAATASGTFSAISGATASSYTLTSNDENMWVRATATYTERRGSAKTANATTGPIAANSPAAFAETSVSRTVAENTVSGNVGSAVSATDADGDTLTYSVAQATSGGADDLTAFNEDFVLDTATGQISVKANGSIDFEDRASYIVVIEVTDSIDSSTTIDDTVTLTINVSDVEEPGAVTVSGTARVGETLTADVTDPDGDVTSVGWVWSRAATASGTFSAISGATASSYTLTSNDENMWVRATATYTDRRGSAKTANATTGSIAANSPAAFAAASVSRTVAENTVSGNVGAAVSATDADGDTLTYSVSVASISGGAENLTAFNEDFVLDTATGQISVKANGSIDFEDRASYIVVIEVTDSIDSSTTIDDTVTLTINVSDVEEPGAVTVSGTARVGETLTADVTDPDGDVTGVTWVWSRAATASGTFSAISGATASSYTLTSNDENMWVRATATYTDRRGSAKTANATTGSIAANSPAAFAAASVSRTVAENTVSGNVGAAVSATDADGDTLTYSVSVASISGGAENLTAFNEDFVLDTATGQISVKANGSIDFEDRASYIVVIEVTDSIDSSTTIDDTVTLTINVSDVEEPGAVTVSGTARVGETLTADVTDPDGDVTGVTWVWSRAATASGTFSAISGATASSYTLTSNDENMWVSATATYTERRGSGKTATATTGSIAANSPAAFAETSVSRTVAENTVSGNVGAAVSASDADGDTLTYSVAQATLGGADDLTAFNEDFVLDTATGQISVKAGGSIDFEVRASYIVVIEVTDSIDSSTTIDDTVTLTINITDVEEPGMGGGDGEAEESSEALTAAQRFNDVDEDDWFVDPVGWMLKNEITTGCEPDRFCPHLIATRAHVVTFLWRAAGRPEPAVSGDERFDDVDESAYYQQATGWAAAEGITTGCEPDRFCPDLIATRAHVVTFLWRAAGRPEPAVSGDERFDDVDESAYYQQATGWAAAEGITRGCDGGNTFCPHQRATRGQVATFLYRYFTQQPQPDN